MNFSQFFSVSAIQRGAFGALLCTWPTLSKFSISVCCDRVLDEFFWPKKTRKPLIICLSSCMTLSRWAVFKTPLLFHYTGWLIGIPLLDYYNPNILGSISQLIICPARGFEHFSGVPTDSSMANPQVPSVPRSLPSCAMCARSSWQSCSTAGPKKTPQSMSITMVQQRPQGIRHKWWQLSSIWWWEYHSMGNIS